MSQTHPGRASLYLRLDYCQEASVYLRLVRSRLQLDMPFSQWSESRSYSPQGPPTFRPNTRISGRQNIG